MFSTPRWRSSFSVGATTEKGTSATACSRSIAVTVTSSSRPASRPKSAEAVPPSATRTSRRLWRLNPRMETATEYTPGGTLTE
jgi:hypothetical protein